MEKETERRIIVLTGPESTGKTTLAKALAEAFGCPLGEEYSRDYLNALPRPYQVSDLEEIARGQLEIERKLLGKESDLIILDTDLLVIFLWAKIKYQRHFYWMETILRNQSDRLYLLCAPDIPWEADPLRENPNDREEIFEVYSNEMNTIGLNYKIISGTGSIRLDSARKAIDNWK